MNFKEFLEQEELLEVMSQPKEPLNGKWVDMGSGSYEYHFDVSKDMDCQEHPCYAVFISSMGNGVSVSFKKRGERYEDTGVGAPMEVGNAVTYAVGEFIRNHQPQMLTWAAVGKTRANAKNTGARKQIYAKWMASNFFPEYIPGDTDDPVNSQIWIRKDYYEKEYASRGYPPVPEAGHDPRSKRQAHKAFVQSILDITQKRDDSRRAVDGERETADERIRTADRERTAAQRAQEAQQRQEQEREREEALQRIVQDPQHNPLRLKIGDAVMSQLWGSRAIYGTIQKFYNHEIHHMPLLYAVLANAVDNNRLPIHAMSHEGMQEVKNLRKISSGKKGREIHTDSSGQRFKNIGPRPQPTPPPPAQPNSAPTDSDYA